MEPTAIRPLLRLLKKELSQVSSADDCDVIDQAVAALRTLATIRPVVALLAARLEKETDEEIRFHLIANLASLNHPAGINPLLKQLKVERNELRRSEIVEALLSLSERCGIFVEPFFVDKRGTKRRARKGLPRSTKH